MNGRLAVDVMTVSSRVVSLLWVFERLVGAHLSIAISINTASLVAPRVYRAPHQCLGTCDRSQRSCRGSCSTCPGNIIMKEEQLKKKREGSIETREREREEAVME